MKPLNIKIVQYFLNLSPWLFIVSFVLTVGIRVAYSGVFPDTVNEEYGSTQLRWITIGLLYMAFILSPVTILVNLFLFFKRKDNHSYRLVLFFIVGLLVIIYLTMYNPLSLFTWFMG